jgi:hypothetical protein
MFGSDPRSKSSLKIEPYKEPEPWQQKNKETKRFILFDLQKLNLRIIMV